MIRDGADIVGDSPVTYKFVVHPSDESRGKNVSTGRYRRLAGMPPPRSRS
jgi:hypothetical protein